MPVRTCIREHTHREYLAWMAWLQAEWDQPSRTDNYLMQIACEARRVLAKHPANIKLKDFVLKFTTGIEKQGKEKAATESKKRWMGWAGMWSGKRGK